MNAPFNTLFATNAAYSGIDVSQAFKRENPKACSAPEVQNYAFSKLISPCEPNDCLDLDFLTNEQGLKKYEVIVVFFAN